MPIQAPADFIKPKRNVLSRMLRKLRRNVSRETLREQAFALLLVVPMTLLIWIWAEREQVTTQEIFPGSCCVLPDEGFDIDIRDLPNNRLQSFKIKGPKAEVDKVVQRFSGGQTLTVTTPRALPAGTTSLLQVPQLMEDLPDFRDLGVTVESVSPQQISVFVDTIVSEDIAPRLPDDLPFKLGDAPPRFVPSKVRVTGPSRRINELRASNRLAPLLDLTSYGLGSTQPGQPLEATQVPFVAEPGVTRVPAVLRQVVIPIATNEEITYRIQSIPIRVSFPGSLLDRPPSVTLSTPSLANVEVVGSREAIEALQRDSTLLRPEGSVSLVAQDIGQTATKNVELRLPPGVRFSETTPRTISVSVKAAE